MGVAAQHPYGIGDADRGQQLRGLRAGLPAGQVHVHPQRLHDLGADGAHRVQRGHRVLEDGAEPRPEHRAHLGGGVGGQVVARQVHVPAPDRRAGQQAQNGTDQHRLARSRLPDDGQRPAALQGERHPVHGLDQAARRDEVGAQLLHLEQDVADGMRGGGQRGGGLAYRFETALPDVRQRPQPVAHQVERQHGQEHGDRGRQHHVGRGLHERAALVDQPAPGRGGRLDGQAQEGQAALGDDDHGHADERVRRRRHRHVRHDLPPQDAPVAGAQHAGGQHELALGEGERGAPDEPDPRGDAEHTQHDQHVTQVGTGEGDHGQREHQRGERLRHVVDRHDDRVRGLAAVAGQDAERGADSQAEQDGADADTEGDAGAVHDPAEHVAAETVGAERVRGAGTRLGRPGERLVITGERQQVGQERGQQDQPDPADRQPEAEPRPPTHA